MKKVRCIDDNGMSNLENGQIYEVELVYNDLGGEPLYRLKGVSGSKYASRFEEVIEPKFKVGDFVKGIGNRYGVTNSHMTKGVVRYVGGEDEIGVQILERDGNPISDDVVFDVSEEHFELWEEPKPEVKERATVKKVRCIDATYTGKQLESNKVYEVVGEGNWKFNGNEYYYLKGIENQRFSKSRFEDVVEEKYPQIVKFNTFKVIFNPPYTIVEMPIMFSDRKYTGKAKCNPEDTYDKWTGYKLAYERMMESKPCSK